MTKKIRSMGKRTARQKKQTEGMNAKADVLESVNEVSDEMEDMESMDEEPVPRAEHDKAIQKVERALMRKNLVVEELKGAKSDLQDEVRVVKRREQRARTAKDVAVEKQLDALKLNDELHEDIKQLKAQNSEIQAHNSALLMQNSSINHYLQTEIARSGSLMQDYHALQEEKYALEQELAEMTSHISKKVETLEITVDQKKEVIQNLSNALQNIKKVNKRAQDSLGKKLDKARASAQTISLKEGGAYSDDVRDLCRILTQAGVSFSQAGPTIKDILETLGFTVSSNVPGRRTVSRTITEGSVMSDMQMGREMAATRGHTISGDGTTIII